MSATLNLLELSATIELVPQVDIEVELAEILTAEVAWNA
jgi:hypothetical protein